MSRVNKKQASPTGAARATSFDAPLAKAFGEVIRALRAQTGLAQDRFALVAGIDRSYFGKLERGERQPSLALLLKVARGLGVKGSELVELTESAMERARRERSRSRREN